MCTVLHLLETKGRTVVTISADATVLEGSRLMNEHRIGSLVVIDQARRPIGMFTERDVLTRVVAQERSPSKTVVRDVMTERVLTCTPETGLDTLRHTMRQQRIRHIPVVENGGLVGMVSIGDLNTAEVKVLCETIQYLEQYAYRS